MSLRSRLAVGARVRHYTQPQRLRRQAHRGADVLAGTISRVPEFDRWRRERFYAAAGDMASAIEIMDRNGRRYLVSTHDPFVGRELFVKGSFEVAKIDAAERILRDRDIRIEHVLDIGANIGTTTIEWLSRFPDATGHAFEPAPGNVRLLRYNLAANGLRDRVIVEEVALSDQDGHAALELSPENPGDHSVRVGDPLGREAVQIRTARLDSLIEHQIVKAPESTFVCIDVQGHEGQAMLGASGLLARKPPLMCEFWPAALRRCGGYDRLIDILASYPVLFEVSRQPQPLTLRDLLNIDEAAIEAVGELELLALPW
jgi:FkbM family methyltransferase